MAAFHYIYKTSVTGEGHLLCDGDYTDGLAVYVATLPAWVGRLGTGTNPYYYDLGRWALDRYLGNDAGYPATPVMPVDNIDANQGAGELANGAFQGILHFPMNLVAYYRLVGHNFFWWLEPGVGWDIYALKYF